MSVNEVLLSTITNLTATENVSGDFLMMIADRRALPEHPALRAGYRGSINGLLSTTLRIPHAGLMGYDIAGAVAENAQVANTALSSSYSTITVTPYGFARSASDLARIVRGNILNSAVMAQDALVVHSNRLTQLVCDAIDGYTLTGGTSGQDLEAADVLAALGTAEVGNLTGPFMGVVHGQQWADLMLDLGLSASGAIQYMPATAELVQFRGEAFKGSFLGVDFFAINRVNSNGTDRLGAIFGPNAVLWADATPQIDDPSSQMVIGGRVLFERERDARARETAWVSSVNIGVSIGLQNGLTLGSDA